MSRAINLLLEAGLIVSALGALAYAIRIILGTVINISWYWGGAIGAFAGPVAFAAALNLYQRCANGRIEQVAS
jgi:hypothetical protein